MVAAGKRSVIPKVILLRQNIRRSNLRVIILSEKHGPATKGNLKII